MGQSVLAIINSSLSSGVVPKPLHTLWGISVLRNMALDRGVLANLA